MSTVWPARARSMGSLPLALLTALVVLCVPAPARAQPSAAERPLYTIAIGQNRVPPSFEGVAGDAPELHYADDDAIQLYQLMRGLSRKAFLLTVPDADTQARFADVAGDALPPTLAALDQTVTRVNDAMTQDRAAGREPVLVFFFSGHGVRDANGNAALALFDGALTRRWLDEKLLARLPARFVHLVIDACHAGAIVRSRDVNATVETLSDAEVADYVEMSTLARFPHVGAILASTADTQSFEWDAYRGGIFAHELLSGLRGVADVNSDGRVEYSELSAFFSAANLHVDDPRARLEVIVQAPRLDARAPVIVHTDPTSEFRLVGRGEGLWSDAFHVESERGSRLLDAFPERGTGLKLWLPAGERLYVVRGDQEVVLTGTPGSVFALASLKLRPVRNRPRGSLESSLRRGLFATRFGPAFYLGFTSERDGLVPVPLAPEPAPPPPLAVATTAKPAPSRERLRTFGVAFVVAGGVAAVTAGVFTGLAIGAHAQFEATAYERDAENARERFNRYQSIAWATGVTAVVLGATGTALLLWPSSPATSATQSAPAVGLSPSGLTLHGRF